MHPLLERNRLLLHRGKRMLSPSKWRSALALKKALDQDLRQSRPFFERAGKKPGTKKVLFASFILSPYTLKMEGLLARALEERGWEAAFLPDPLDNPVIVRYHADLFGHRKVTFDENIPWTRRTEIEALVDRILDSGVEAIKAFEHAGSMVGISALSTFSSSNGMGSLESGDAASRSLLKTLMIRSCLYTEASERILRTLRPDLVIAVEKGGVGASEIFFQCLRLGVDFVQWHSCHEPETLMLKRYHSRNVRSHPFSISPASWEKALAEEWKEEHREEVMREFEEGYASNKWFQYKKLTDDKRMLDRSEIISRFGLDPAKKTAVIFSHILNDANLFYGEDLFKGGFKEWLVETVRAARANDRVNWVLKLHPANLYRRANANYTGEYGEILAIREALGEIPAFLKVIYPDNDINPLSLFKALDYAVTVRGTVGAEIPCFGKTVLTAGTGRYSGRGFTEDSQSREEYLEKLKRIEDIPPLDDEAVRKALLHARLFFKVRPAPYSSFARDIFSKGALPVMARNLGFHADHYSEALKDPRLSAIADWLESSRAEDYLNPWAG